MFSSRCGTSLWHKQKIDFDITGSLDISSNKVTQSPLTDASTLLRAHTRPFHYPHSWWLRSSTRENIPTPSSTPATSSSSPTPRPSHVCDLTQMCFSISLLDPGSDSRRYRVEGTYQSESGGGTLRLQHKRGFESQSLPELHMDSGLVYM